MKINLGCGNNILEGYVNYDLYPCSDSVRKLDLNKLPLSLPSNYADVILLSHVLEHLVCDKFAFMKDIHRILKPEGRVIVKLPVYCNIIQHTQFAFSYHYLNSLFNGSDDNLEYAPPLFSLVRRTRHKSLRVIVNQIKNRVIDLFSSEYEWELMKR
jgi:ubiquinone/menaquinone biosynthesis C-methylase UbiE